MLFTSLRLMIFFRRDYVGKDIWRAVTKADQLPEGGQAHTFLVTDTKGEGTTQYVLKRLKREDRLHRFKKEVEAYRNLQHENIVKKKLRLYSSS